ncbi:hypothetical protein [Pantoea sp. LMR881]|nr:hypothetical protein [Pantoea sp. LMR881]
MDGITLGPGGTYGGDELACAAALAVLDLLEMTTRCNVLISLASR